MRQCRPGTTSLTGPGRSARRTGSTTPTARPARGPRFWCCSTYRRAYADSNGFLTLLSDGEALTGAYALGPEASERLQQATLAIRAKLPLEVLQDTIQPFPTFSEAYLSALTELVPRRRRTTTLRSMRSTSPERAPARRGRRTTTGSKDPGCWSSGTTLSATPISLTQSGATPRRASVWTCLPPTAGRHH